MPAPQTSYTQYQGRWAGAGFDPEMSTFDNRTGVVETVAGIPFGRAVSQGATEKGMILGGTKFMGVSVMDQFQVPSPSVPVADFFPYRSNFNFKTRGPIVVKNMSGGAVAPHDPVFYDPATGNFANAAGAVAVAAPTYTGTGNGVLTRSTPAYAGDPMAGEWIIRFVEAAANGGRFIIVAPDLDQAGEGVVGTEVNINGLPRFTIADGATDFVVGDTFKLVVSKAAEGPIPGARWQTPAADAGLAIIHLGIQK